MGKCDDQYILAIYIQFKRTLLLLFFYQFEYLKITSINSGRPFLSCPLNTLCLSLSHSIGLFKCHLITHLLCLQAFFMRSCVHMNTYIHKYSSLSDIIPFRKFEKWQLNTIFYSPSDSRSGVYLGILGFRLPPRRLLLLSY